MYISTTNGELEYIIVGLYAYSFYIILIEQFQECSIFYISRIYINIYMGTDPEFCPIYCTIIYMGFLQWTYYLLDYSDILFFLTVVFVSITSILASKLIQEKRYGPSLSIYNCNNLPV